MPKEGLLCSINAKINLKNFTLWDTNYSSQVDWTQRVGPFVAIRKDVL
jgi:hypothetical protein